MGNKFLEVAMKYTHLLGRKKQKKNKNLTKHILQLIDIGHTKPYDDIRRVRWELHVGNATSYIENLGK